MKKINKLGFNLVELMVVVAISGILILVFNGLFMRANLLIQRLNAAQGGTCFATATGTATGTPLVCFDAGKADGCDSVHTCSYVSGNWQRDNKLCDAGVLVKGTCN